MKKRDHGTVIDARRELVAAGFVTAFSSPGRPECWGKTKDTRRFAIAREDRQRCKKWHITEYPGSPVCGPDELLELNARDGVIARGVESTAECAYLE